MRLRAGLAYLLSPASPKYRRKQADFPGELGRLELRGILAGRPPTCAAGASPAASGPHDNPKV